MAASADLPKVLCVDDERRVLEGIRRHLRKEFDLTLAPGAEKGLDAVRDQGPFEVVISDLQMPGMDGIEMLSRMQELAPLTVRVLLTGNANVDSAVSAVNEGNIFRFLTKPCPAEKLSKTVHAAIEQHRLLTAEKVLLEQTLHGSVQMLTDVLAMADPAAFGRATRLKQLAGDLSDALGLDARW
ncbi:MAG: response regulator, partial [Proteobacteria bacterium]|nr:response regulator [Pseudomonadota bacterium]